MAPEYDRACAGEDRIQGLTGLYVSVICSYIPGTMITRTPLSDDAARHAIEHHEFPSDVLNSSRTVAVVSTQSWCPDWKRVDRWLRKLVDTQKPDDFDLDVYTVIYDREPYFNDYRAVKEHVWKNGFVPYIRYYVDGEFVADSNQLSADRFLDIFRSHLKETAQ